MARGGVGRTGTGEEERVKEEKEERANEGECVTGKQGEREERKMNSFRNLICTLQL